jgi:hypothetical protein
MTKDHTEKIGRLFLFGITAPWQVALFLPLTWDDFTSHITRYDSTFTDGSFYAIAGCLDWPPKTRTQIPF